MIYILLTSKRKSASIPHHLHSILITKQNSASVGSHQPSRRIPPKSCKNNNKKSLMCFSSPQDLLRPPPTIITPKNRQIASFSPHQPSRQLPTRSCTNNNQISENYFLILSWFASALTPSTLILPSWQICFKPHRHHPSTYDNHNFLTRPTSKMHLVDPVAIIICFSPPHQHHSPWSQKTENHLRYVHFHHLAMSDYLRFSPLIAKIPQCPIQITTK